MKDVLDILYDSQIQTNAYNRKVSTAVSYTHLTLPTN